jgi:general secretion pathway protein I
MQKSNRGMTLIEVLVAFIVLSLTMAVIMRIFSGGMRNARLAESYSRAVFLAESRLATVGVERPLAPGEETGKVGPNFNWSVTVVAVDDNGVADQLMMPVRLYRIRARVGWSEEGRERQIELLSLRVGPR